MTWLSQIVANAFLAFDQSEQVATFSSVRNYIPDLSVSSRIQAYRFQRGTIAFYKSHGRFNPNYVHTVYLVRHPFAVMRSYHRYVDAFGAERMSFGDFLDHSRYGLPAWKEHVRSWVDSGRDSNRFFLHLVRYEDLVNDAVQILDELNTNFGWGLPGAAIDSAVERSSRTAMQEQEQLYRKHNPGHEFSFVGADYAEEQYEKYRAQVASYCAAELELLGYLE